MDALEKLLRDGLAQARRLTADNCAQAVAETTEICRGKGLSAVPLDIMVELKKAILSMGGDPLISERSSDVPTQEG